MGTWQRGASQGTGHRRVGVAVAWLGTRGHPNGWSLVTAHPPRPSWDPWGSKRHPNDGTVPVPRAVTALAPLRKPGGDITVTFPGLPQTRSRNPELGNPGKGLKGCGSPGRPAERAQARRGQKRWLRDERKVFPAPWGFVGAGSKGKPPRGAARSPSHPILLPKHGEQLGVPAHHRGASTDHCTSLNPFGVQRMRVSPQPLSPQHPKKHLCAATHKTERPGTRHRGFCSWRWNLQAFSSDVLQCHQPRAGRDKARRASGGSVTAGTPKASPKGAG